jgi:trans-aconitate methyltransferase
VSDTWDTIADWYTERLRAGSAMHDLAGGALLARLPQDLRGVRVLDVGCGEGLLTRALSARGAVVHGIDSAPRMIEHAQEQQPTTATYAVDDGATLSSVASTSVDWVTAGLALNNVPDLGAALAAAHRVLVAGGHLVFTIPHPCFEAPHATWTESGGRVIGAYLDEGFWRSGNPQGARRAGNQHRTISTYLNALIGAGYRIETMAEPVPTADVVAEQPQRSALPPFALLQAQRD